MKIKRYNIKSKEKCSSCGNKSVKPFEILIIENGLTENIFYICDRCQNLSKLESEELTSSIIDNKLYAK